MSSIKVNTYHLKRINYWLWQKFYIFYHHQNPSTTIFYACESTPLGQLYMWNSTWNNELTIHKFSAITKVESQIHVWKCTQNGLPTGQLSFLQRAGSDSYTSSLVPGDKANTLPTPLNLQHWKLKTDSKWPLCNNPWPTIQYMLNSCIVALFRKDTPGNIDLQDFGQWSNKEAPTMRKALCWPTRTRSDW